MVVMEQEVIPYEKRRDFLLNIMKKQAYEQELRDKAEEKEKAKKLKSISKRYR
jgi:hypothetical protein